MLPGAGEVPVIIEEDCAGSVLETYWLAEVAGEAVLTVVDIVETTVVVAEVVEGYILVDTAVEQLEQGWLPPEQTGFANQVLQYPVPLRLWQNESHETTVGGMLALVWDADIVVVDPVVNNVVPATEPEVWTEELVMVTVVAGETVVVVDFVVGIVVGKVVEALTVVDVSAVQVEHGWFPPEQTGLANHTLQYPAPLRRWQYESHEIAGDWTVVPIGVVETGTEALVVLVVVDDDVEGLGLVNVVVCRIVVVLTPGVWVVTTTGPTVPRQLAHDTVEPKQTGAIRELLQ